MAEEDELDSREAEARVALQDAPNDPRLLTNLANLLVRKHAFEDALPLMHRAVAAAPDQPIPHYNLGILKRKLAQIEESVGSFQAALALRPHFAQAAFNLSLSLLGLGRWGEAWPLFEYRHSARGLKPPVLDLPRWQGEPLAGKSLLVWPDDGLGDQIQVFRYAARLRDLGLSRLTWLTSPGLVGLLQDSAPYLTALPASGAVTFARHDYWIPAMSLPLRLGADPAGVTGSSGYLRASDAHRATWNDRLRNSAGALRVGLIWRGNSEHFNDRHRSLPGLEVLRPLWNVPGVRFFSLQKGAGEAQAASPPPDQPLTDLGPALLDFRDTAAAVDAMDLVISIDSSPAHLAGALGRPCLLLLPAFETDWRWLRERADTPWYDSLTLFRQEVAGDWSGPVARAAAFLASLAAA